jgi:methyltransferase FkbM-like protein
MLGDKSSESIDILCMTWPQWKQLVSPEKIDLLKIDIEGGEFDFLPSIQDYLAEHKPVVYLSLHAPFLDKEIRKEKLQLIVDTMKVYTHCYNENFEEIQLESLLSEENQNQFNAFIFKN